MDITKQKKTIPGAAAIFTPASAPANCSARIARLPIRRMARNPQPSTLNPQFVEAGAHDGRLARDILSWLQLKRPQLFGQIEYCIIEASDPPAGMAKAKR
jgi:hypothetical protein